MLSSRDRNPYVFIVGCPRSGTTLLQRMLDNHPDLAVVNDSHFIPKALEAVPGATDQAENGNEVELTSELVHAVLNYPRFARIRISQETVREMAAATDTYQEFVGALYTEFARTCGKSLAGEKTPDYVRSLKLLHALFPWAKTVHIIRDGRDVVLSALEWARSNKGPGKFALWQREPVAVCALWWSRQVRKGCRHGTKLGPKSYRELSYESLVRDAETELRSIAEFLGLAFAPSMLTYHEGKTRVKPGRSAKNQWLPPTIGLRDWQTQMAPRDVELFEALAGDVLAELGYERAFEKFSPQVADTAASCRDWWSSKSVAEQA